MLSIWLVHIILSLTGYLTTAKLHIKLNVLLFFFKKIIIIIRVILALEAVLHQVRKL